MKASLFIILCLLTISLIAQPNELESTVNTPPAAATTASTSSTNQIPSGVNLPPQNSELSPTKSSQEVWLSFGVLIFGIVVVIAQSLLIHNKEVELNNALKYLSVSMIIVGALFLVTAGYGNSQIAPIIGLLGTVAGYLLGRTSPPTKP